MKSYQLAITTEELGYVAIHVERLRKMKDIIRRRITMKAYMQRMGVR